MIEAVFINRSSHFCILIGDFFVGRKQIKEPEETGSEYGRNLQNNHVVRLQAFLAIFYIKLHSLTVRKGFEAFRNN